MSGQLRPGEFIRLDAVAQQLGTSVTPVREALVLLRGEGMVRLIPRRGYVVSPLSRQDVEDLFEMQAYIGAEIVARAAARIDEATLAALAAHNRELQAAIRAKDSASIMRCEYEFHRTLNAAADSRKLAYMLNNATKYLPQRFYGADAQWRNAAANDHKIILEALRARDGDAARASVISHVRDGKQRLIEHLDSIDFWA
jgi:DNA-binding GntR family transcriptional regulator